MKQLIQLGIFSSLLISSTTFAINSHPVQGLYIGLLAGIAHGPSNNTVTFVEDAQRFTGTVSYSPIGAGGGGVLGYKIANFRTELELLYNRISTGPLRVNPGDCTLENVDIVTPSGLCTSGTYDRFQAKALGYQGSSAVTYGLLNMYYDIFTQESHTDFFPYIGVGIGEAYIRDFSNFVNTNTTFSHGNNVSFSAPAIQGILGAGFFMDDFTWASMDLRYLSTTKTYPQLQNRRYGLIALMFNISFALDKGGIDLG
ncbi:P44/Msp2 family outer membrane protein [Legionella fallonii]|uniref:Msp4/OMP-like domain-containing protein n=1 Tax=Legionella fallonii LLAP-10 TaxID=1212491 RepID=A0A098G695_9GAMM|nr:P44/Msp2 family outer membrane protein [Legionella fallonii]CEG57489.1 conserved exported protein of unknown function [Legionella fallonii LLAP-10]